MLVYSSEDGFAVVIWGVRLLNSKLYQRVANHFTQALTVTGPVIQYTVAALHSLSQFLLVEQFAQ